MVDYSGFVLAKNLLLQVERQALGREHQLVDVEMDYHVNTQEGENLGLGEKNLGLGEKSFGLDEANHVLEEGQCVVEL